MRFLSLHKYILSGFYRVGQGHDLGSTCRAGTHQGHDLGSTCRAGTHQGHDLGSTCRAGTHSECQKLILWHDLGNIR